jgi:hypothetical protein
VSLIHIVHVYGRKKRGEMTGGADVLTLDFELRLRNLLTDEVETIPLRECAVPPNTFVQSGAYALTIHDCSPAFKGA